ncbi:lengsin [Brachyhypopomus gauderio]|uniref:lengsin n=1 Tax=Brachyhypopomus gauderio TaxID=698409 RepID=UPI004042A31A
MESDQVDGGRLSHSRKKEVIVNGKRDDWVRKGTYMPIVQTDLPVPKPQDNPTVISIGSCSQHAVTTESQGDDVCADTWCRGAQQDDQPHIGGVSKQTVQELKSVLKQRSLLSPREAMQGRSVRSQHMPGKRRDCRPDEEPFRSFTTFKPVLERTSGPREITSSGWDSGGSPCTDGPTNRPCSSHSRTSHSDNKENVQIGSRGSQSFISVVEHIKQRIVCENIGFIRFEAADLHGVSRSKMVPSHFFHEKAVHGVPMPRSYLELTLSPRENEVDHPTAPSFSNDVLLVPDLSTFRALPWVEQTARLICDPCTITGTPLHTSPRIVAKVMLGQLQHLGFSFFSSFIYECCILDVSEGMDPKLVLFPATTLLSNHDTPFLQQLMRGMYHMGVDVDSFASASGPGQIEVCFKPKFGIEAADCAFTFRTGLKEMARKYNYLATFLTDDTIYNSGILCHSLWDASGTRSLFQSGTEELSEIGKKWLSGLLLHSPALSCLLAPGTGCRAHLTKGKDSKQQYHATYGCNNNSCTFNVKVHGGREAHIDNRLGSATANPYIVLAATIAAGLDGIKCNLSIEEVLNRTPAQQKKFAIPVKLEDALEALGEDSTICGALGESFVQYFIAMKRLESETQALDRKEGLEYFI